jgi:hypothetical protein
MMKPNIALKLVMAAALLFAAQAASAAVCAAGTVCGTPGKIAGSSHDFVLDANSKTCVACHAPHNTNTATTTPLWNRASTSTTYTAYSSNTIAASRGLVPGDSSKLCLSCHDGSVAIDNFLGTGGNPSSTNKITTSRNLYKDGTLNNDHPIGVLYTDTSHDSSYNKPTTTTVVLGETGTNTKTVKVADLLSSEGKVECASCHDVHNTFVVSLPGMLKVSNLASAPATKQLCAACHNK